MLGRGSEVVVLGGCVGVALYSPKRWQDAQSAGWSSPSAVKAMCWRSTRAMVETPFKRILFDVSLFLSLSLSLYIYSCRDMYINIYIYIYMYLFVYIFVYVRYTDLSTYVHMYTSTVHIHACRHPYIHACPYIDMHVCGLLCRICIMNALAH